LVHSGIGDLIVGAVEVGHLLAEEPHDHLDAFLEPVESLLDRAELDPVGVGLLQVPARPHPEIEPAAGDVIDRGRHVGRYRGVAVVHPVDHAADPNA
jgi:hypothetical protein